MENLLTFNFNKGVNEYKDETLLDINQASKSQNVDISSGILSTIKEPSIVQSRSDVVRMAKFYSGDDCTLIPLNTNSDYLNYQTGDTEVMLLGDGISPVQVYNGSYYRDLENRRTVDVESLNIPGETTIWGGSGSNQMLLAAHVKGGSKENSIKVRISPENGSSSICYKRSSTATSYSTRSNDAKLPYDALVYVSESDILDTYVGEVITFFEKGTIDGSATTYSNPIIINYVKVTVTEAMITSKIITPTTYSDVAPKGSLIELNHERVWLAGDVDNPNRVYFSKDFDIDDWTIPTEDEGETNQHGGLIDFPTWDAGKIIGLKVLFGDLFVFKPKHIFRIFGTYPGNYQSEQICSVAGAISDRSIVASPSAVYFASQDGIYVFNGTSPTLISQRIKNTWKNLNKNYLKNAVGIFYNNRYYLAVPEGGSAVNNLIIEYNTDDDTFTFIRGITVKDFIEYNGYMYFSNSNGIYNMFQSDSNSATGYEANWTTGKNNFGQNNTIKTTQKLYFLGSGNGSIQISVENEKGKVKSITIPLTSTETMYRKRLKNKGRTLKFSISSVSGSKFKLKAVQITYEEDAD